MKIYPDTNFLVRLYLPFPESQLGRAKLVESRTLLSLTWLSEMEVLNAFERYVFETQNGAPLRVSPGVAAAAQADFRMDRDAGSLFAITAPSITAVRSRFEELALRHTARHGFRTYDILHVASAIALECDTFWSFDTKACHLAKLEGLQTF